MDVTKEAGIGSKARSGVKTDDDKAVVGASACFIDYDNDSKIDLFLADNGPQGGMALYHNLGNGKFEDVSKQAGLDPTAHALSCTAGDYAIPQTLRTVVATSGNSIIGVPFLTFNNNVRQSGPTALWDFHAVYFYKHLAILSEWGSGFQDYSTGGSQHTRLPIESFYVQASYLITGETRSGIGIVKPINPVSLAGGRAEGDGFESRPNTFE